MAEKTQKAKVYVGVRLDPDHLKVLTDLGAAAKPVPANQSEMIQAAIREYVERHGPKKRGK